VVVIRSAQKVAFKTTRTAMLAIVSVAAGCQDPNAVAMRIGQPVKAPLAVREAQTRTVSAPDEETALANITQSLQDLGFAVSESSADLGIVTGNKKRDAEENGAVAAQIALTVAFAVLGAAYQPTWDKVQDIHVTAVVAPTRSPADYSIRVSFDRYMTNNRGEQWRTELIQDPAIYQEFFDKLSFSSTLAKRL